jgi:hypothetical protein
MADTATAIIAGFFSLATAMGTMYMQDYLARRRADLSQVQPLAKPRRSKRTLESEPIVVPSAAPMSVPVQQQWAAPPEPFFKRYSKSLKIALVGLIVGALVGQDYEKINAAADPNSEAGAMFGLAYLAFAIIVPAYLFYTRRTYTLKWDYWAFFIDCTTLILCFAAGIGFTSRGDAPDQLTNVLIIMFGMAIIALVPIGIIDYVAGRIFYKPKIPV